MSRKVWIGVVLVLVGIAVVIFANHQKGRVSSAKEDIDSGTGLFSIGGNPVAKTAGNIVRGGLQDKASSYDTPLMLLQVGGIILIVLGAGVALVAARKKRK